MTINEIDVSGFVSMCDELSKLSGRDFADVLLLQVGAVMKACIRRTPARTPGQIIKHTSRKAGFIKFADGRAISTWTGAAKWGGTPPEMFLDTSNFSAKRNPKSKAPRVNGDGMSWHQMNDPKRHWNNDRWARFQALDAMRPEIIRERIRKALKGRGLAKQTWWQSAQELGLDTSIAPSYVRSAESPDGKVHKEGFAKRIVEDAAYMVEVSNANPLVVGKLRGQWIIEGALRDREKAFAIDMEKGTFDGLKRRAQRYPGIFSDS